MKKLTALLLCLGLCLAALAACDSGSNDPAVTTGKDSTTTAPATEETTASAGEETTAPAGNDTAEDTTAPEETTSAGEQEYDPELYVVIKTAEDLMALNKAAVEALEPMGIIINDIFPMVYGHTDEMICDDQLHLSETGAKKIAARVAEVIRNAAEAAE